jgi:hypothetical protein
VEVSNIEGKLVDDDTWVETNVTVGARQVIRDTVPSALRPDMSITFNHSGGKIHIGRVRVRADHHYLFERGERYLVFLRRISREGMVSVGLVKFPFRITDDQRLAPMTMSTGTPMTVPSPLYGLDLKTVIAELKARIRPQ